MNVDAILQPAIAFSSEGIGAVMLNIAQVIYTALFPANSQPAHPVIIPA